MILLYVFSHVFYICVCKGVVLIIRIGQYLRKQ